ncbi:hypothetical protein G1C96_1502 [Bifidobacterium sp. DSM 109958]|uniref:Uncharacterized protein n=1 Tax=Bifidobacterium moraviense TaxID=2675323 RepID=A0A7Y0HY50_9BIFI|nr:hypothetical protein [Bifidobacterium sp. DSM 109958]NMN00921.1 hypothetical protein [Bifidobacterium sp. DSM 109958]
MSDDPRSDDLNDDFNDDFNSDDAHFSDEELEAALAGFEKEFAEEDAKNDAKNDGASAGDADAGTGELDGDPSAGFDDELEGLLGNKAKAAVLITRLASAELLAAFCQISDISADCVTSKEGAVAVLSNLSGDGPEAAARDLTTVVNGMAIVLAVNRADKLEATMYLKGKAGETFAPPVLFSSTAPFVEDLMLGITTVDGLRGQGLAVVPTSGYDHDAAMKVIAEHTRFGRGGATHGSRVQ